MIRTMSQPFDCEGRHSRAGSGDVAWVVRALQHPFFALPPPKSLDRNRPSRRSSSATYRQPTARRR